MREGTLKENVLDIGNDVEEVVADEDIVSHGYIADLSNAAADMVRSLDIDQWVVVVYDYDGKWYPGCFQEVCIQH